MEFRPTCLATLLLAAVMPVAGQEFGWAILGRVTNVKVAAESNQDGNYNIPLHRGGGIERVPRVGAAGRGGPGE